MSYKSNQSYCVDVHLHNTQNSHFPVVRRTLDIFMFAGDALCFTTAHVIRCICKCRTVTTL